MCLCFIPHLWWEVWIMTKRMKSWIQVDKKSFLLVYRVVGLSLRDKAMSSVIWGRGLEWSRWSFTLKGVGWGGLGIYDSSWFPLEIFKACPTGENPEVTGGIVNLLWNTLGCPGWTGECTGCRKHTGGSWKQLEVLLSYKLYLKLHHHMCLWLLNSSKLCCVLENHSLDFTSGHHHFSHCLL